MKVFSKNHKNNKSSPSFQSLAYNSTSTQSKKPKGMNKIKTFKQILTQNIHGLTNMKQNMINKQQNNKYDHSKILFTQNSSSDSYINHNLVLSDIKMINSIQQSVKTDRQYRKNNVVSTDKIHSVIYSSNKSKDITPFQKNKGFQHDQVKNIMGFQLSNISNMSNKSNKENQQNISMINNDHNSKQNNNNSNQKQFKKINHYKNTRVNYNHNAVLKKWKLKDFNMGKRLGKGRFGQVYLVQQKQTGLIFAMKKINIILVKEQQMQNQIIQQIKLQLYLNHPNILKMYGFFKQGNDLCLILQYAQEKCLFNKLCQKIDEKTCHYYILQMIKALKQCHSQFVLHRDLKPQNILISFGVAKLADFGWAAYAPKYKRQTFCGTLDYVSPEILKGHWYDQRVDIWSLGVLIYELSTGKAPFQSRQNNHNQAQKATMNRILKCQFQIPQTLSYQLQALIESILNSEPEDRPTLQQIQCCAWMSKYKNEGLQIDKQIWNFWNKICEK